MIWCFLILAFTAQAQVEDSPLLRGTNKELQIPEKIISLYEIQKSEVRHGALKENAVIKNLETNQTQQSSKMIYVKYYALEDEQGQKYILNENNDEIWVTPGRFISPIKETLVLHEPPHKYTPAPENTIKAQYDQRLRILPEIGFSYGVVQGEFIRDLYNDPRAVEGRTLQLSVGLFSRWNFPLFLGVGLNFEQTTYDLSSGATLIYQSPSIGPKLKTKDIGPEWFPFHLQTEFRVSPYSRLFLDDDQDAAIDFNSSDLIASLKGPMKNKWGEFIWGVFVQAQWLNLKNQSTPVEIRSSNKTNRSWGLTISQVFK